MTDDIDAKIDRLEEIIEQLEQGDVPLARAKELHDEGRDILAELDAELALDEETVDEGPDRS
jgi:exodeoxyribonuclease VII small subunit